MRKSLIIAGVLIVVLAVVALPSRTKADHRHRDFGSFVESQLAAHSEQLFGINRPLEQSALGPYRGAKQPAGHPGGPGSPRVAGVEQCGIGCGPDRALAE